MSDEGKMSRIITVYYPDPEKWKNQLRVFLDFPNPFPVLRESHSLKYLFMYWMLFEAHF